MWIILLSPVPERYFFLSFVMYFLACLLLLLFFAVAVVCLFVWLVFFTYSLFVFLSFQLSLEELLFVYPGPGCSKLG